MLIANKSGYMTDDRKRQLDESARRRGAQDRELLAKKLRASCNVWVPRYENADLEKIEYPRSLLSAEEFERYLDVRDELRSLLEAPGIIILSGDNGPGKTHLASAMVYAFCDACRESYYCTAIDFYTKLKSTFGEKGKTQEELIERFRRYHCLVIDEIEVRSDSEWENNLLRALIDARHNKFLATILCTNKTPEQLNGDNGTPYLSNAIRDRMNEGGAILHCNWRSLRELGKQAKP